MSSHAPQVLQAAAIVPIAADPLEPGWIAIEAGGIVALGAGPPPSDRGPVHDYGAAVIFPGFVNAHAHLGCSFLAGVADDAGFFEWITGGIQPRVMRALDQEQGRIRDCARAAARELLAGGTTCVAEGFFHDAGAEAGAAAGLRGRFHREFFGARAPDLDEYLARVRDQIADDQAQDWSGWEYGLAPHSLYTCPAAVLALLRDESKARGLPLTLHLDESPEEHLAFRDRRGPLWELLSEGDPTRFRTGLRPVELIQELGILETSPVLVHLVQIEPADVAILADSQAGVVHCPSSNLRLAVGTAPVLDLIEAGVAVALGTDSLASTGRLDMFEEMRLFLLGQRGRYATTRGLNTQRALELATLGGARVLGLDALIGTLTPGRRADLCVVQLDTRPPRDRLSLASQIVWNGRPQDVLATWVDGRCVYERGLGS
ncbi:MAG: amidohydrolase family protein [Planctomycetes bacterium]|nr:amidohydrolase family protein [Planctomycetota bacterium]